MKYCIIKIYIFTNIIISLMPLHAASFSLPNAKALATYIMAKREDKDLETKSISSNANQTDELAREQSDNTNTTQEYIPKNKE